MLPLSTTPVPTHHTCMLRPKRTGSDGQCVTQCKALATGTGETGAQFRAALVQTGESPLDADRYDISTSSPFVTVADRALLSTCAIKKQHKVALLYVPLASLLSHRELARWCSCAVV